MISLIIPCYNEEESIPYFIKEINKVIDLMKKEKFGVSQEDLDKYIENIAKRVNKSSEEYKKSLTDERLNYIRNEILMNKLLEFLVEKNK